MLALTPPCTAHRLVRSVQALCDTLSSEPALKRRMVQAIVTTIFGALPAISEACQCSESALEACSAEVAFEPREEVWGLEGTS